MREHEEESEISITRRHIEERRKAYSRKRRRALFKLMLLMLIGGVFISAVLACTFLFIRWGAGVYHEYKAAYAEYTQQRRADIGAVNPAFDSYTNVLLLGVDEGADPSHEKAQRADTIVVMSFHPSDGQVNFIDIPRGTWVQLPDSEAYDRISSVYAHGGAPAMVRTVRDLTGIAIHQYVVADMNTFASLLDELGGIDLYVECPMDYDDPASNTAIHLKQGYQHLDGQAAMGYLRYRNTDLGDLGRNERQQKFLRLLYDRVLQLDVVPKLPRIAEILKKQVHTSAAVFDSAHLARVLGSLSSQQPRTVMLPGEAVEDDDTVWQPDAAGIVKMRQELFPAAEGEPADKDNAQEE